MAKRDAVALGPSPLALEAAAHALLRLNRRGRRSWTTADFASQTRQRATVPALQMLTILGRARIVDQHEDEWSLTREGHTIVAGLASGDWSGLAAGILQTGAYNTEIEMFLALAETSDGVARCDIARARLNFPCLGTIIAWNNTYRTGRQLAVPIAVFETIMAATAIEIDEETPEWVRDLEAVGRRAEAYTLRRERSLHGPEAVLYVSRESGDRFGYDVEVVGHGSRFIEVKGARSARVSFVLTHNERRAAERLVDRHELQFWGEISLSRCPQDEYELLLAKGYPKVFHGIAEATKDELGWSVNCESWRVMKLGPCESPSE